MSITRDGGTARVTGPATLQTVNALREAGLALIAQGQGLTFDLTGVTEVDSSALSLLLEWRRAARERNATLAFSNLPANLDSLAALYGVGELIAA